MAEGGGVLFLMCFTIPSGHKRGGWPCPKDHIQRDGGSREFLQKSILELVRDVCFEPSASLPALPAAHQGQLGETLQLCLRVVAECLAGSIVFY